MFSLVILLCSVVDTPDCLLIILISPDYTPDSSTARKLFFHMKAPNSAILKVF